MPAAARPEPEIASAMPAQPQSSSSAEMTPIHTVGVRAHALEVLESLDALLAGGLDDLPRDRLLGVVFGGDRADVLLREPTQLGLELQLILVQGEIHGATSCLARKTD